MNYLSYLKQYRKRFFVGLIVLLVLVSGYWLYSLLNGDSKYSGELEENKKVVQALRNEVDQATLGNTSFSRSSDFKVTREVGRMPEFSLALADQEWFGNDGVLLAIASQLGFTKDAYAVKIGSIATWSEGVSTLTIDTQIGTINYSKALNIDDSAVPDGTASEEVAKAKFQDFFDSLKLPQTYFNFNNLSYEYLNLSGEGYLTQVTDGGTGALVKVIIPYEVSTVEMILPIKSYIVVNSSGDIVLMELLLPNIKQGGQEYRLVGIEKATEWLDKGLGVIVEISDSSLIEMEVSSVDVVYYLSQGNYQSLSQKRLLRPIYLFSGNEGQVAVSAVKE